MNVGSLRHCITLENPTSQIMDGDGGYTYIYTPLDPPSVYAEIKPATVRDLERVAAGTVLSTASHVVTIRYHAGVTTETRVKFGTRYFSVVGVMNPEERNIELQLMCVELVGVVQTPVTETGWIQSGWIA